jgi:hypothetical protein
MLYCVLCYSPRGVVGNLTQAQDDALMARLEVVHKDLIAEGKLRERGRLMPTTAATTVRVTADAGVFDGPFAETKEELLGFYLLDCDTLEDAIDATRRLVGPRFDAVGGGSMEIRPFRAFYPAEG